MILKNCGLEEFGRPRQVHVLEITGSNPVSATILMRYSYIGITQVCQSWEEGSIPSYRSSLNDSLKQSGYALPS